MGMTDTFEAMLAQGQDSAVLRYGLGNAYLSQGDPLRAISHLAHAVALDPGYSAAWKLYGKALAAASRHAEIAQAGIAPGIAA